MMPDISDETKPTRVIKSSIRFLISSPSIRHSREFLARVVARYFRAMLRFGKSGITHSAQSRAEARSPPFPPTFTDVRRLTTRNLNYAIA